MNLPRAWVLTVAVALVGGWTLAAQDATAPPDEGEPTLASWEWRQELRLPGDSKTSAYWAVTLPPSTLGKGQPDLRDLRLVDAAGTRVPFALRVLQTTATQAEQPITRTYDSGPVEAKGYYEVTLELGEVGPLGHNQIEIATPGSNFRRRVEVLGDNKADFAEARQLLPRDSYVVHYALEGSVIDIRRLRYPANRVRFLKVRVYTDRSGEDKIPLIEQVRVRFTESVKGEDAVQPASLEPREAARTDQGPGSSWFISLAADPVPCDRLILSVNGPPVERPFRVEIADADRPREMVGTAPWTWRRDNDRWELTIPFRQEVRAKRLKLIVTDFANAPLELSSVQSAAPARQVIFAAPDMAKLKAPLFLYFGNPQASAANYDFARQLPLKVAPAPRAAELLPQQNNPAFVPPLPTLPDRYPWLIYVLLSATSAGLLAMLGLLAKTALRQAA